VAAEILGGPGGPGGFGGFGGFGGGGQIISKQTVRGDLT